MSSTISFASPSSNLTQYSSSKAPSQFTSAFSLSIHDLCLQNKGGRCNRHFAELHRSSMLDIQAVAAHYMAETRSLLSARKATFPLEHLNSTAAMAPVRSDQEHPLLRTCRPSSSSKIKLIVAPADFQQLKETRSSSCGCSETLLAHGTHKILSVLLANIAESIMRMKDFAKLDVHIHVSVISHGQQHDLNCLTPHSRQSRMTRLIALLFVGDLPQLIARRQKVARDLIQGNLEPFIVAGKGSRKGKQERKMRL